MIRQGATTRSIETATQPANTSPEQVAQSHKRLQIATNIYISCFHYRQQDEYSVTEQVTNNLSHQRIIMTLTKGFI